MDPRETFKDKPRIVAAIEAFAREAQKPRPVCVLTVGGVAFGSLEHSAVSPALIDAYRLVDQDMNGHLQDGFAQRKEDLEARAARNERVPATSPLQTLLNFARRRQNGTLSYAELTLLDRTCGEVPAELNSASARCNGVGQEA